MRPMSLQRIRPNLNWPFVFWVSNLSSPFSVHVTKFMLFIFPEVLSLFYFVSLWRLCPTQSWIFTNYRRNWSYSPVFFRWEGKQCRYQMMASWSTLMSGWLRWTETAPLLLTKMNQNQVHQGLHWVGCQHLQSVAVHSLKYCAGSFPWATALSLASGSGWAYVQISCPVGLQPWANAIKASLNPPDIST